MSAPLRREESFIGSLPIGAGDFVLVRLPKDRTALIHYLMDEYHYSLSAADATATTLLGQESK